MAMNFCGKAQPWRHCLSLGAAAWTHSFLLAVAGAWNIMLFMNAFPWRRSLTEAAVQAYAKRSLVVSSGLRFGFLSLAITFLMVSILTDLALCMKSKKLAYILAWINIFSSFLGLLLLMYLWTAFGIMLLSMNATVGELVVWGNVDLMYVILTAVPMTHVYASLGNVFAVGGTGFEGKRYDELASAQKKAEVLRRPSLKMSTVGNWRVGLSLQHAAILWSIFCLAITILDLSVFWVKISDDPMVRMNDIGLVFLVQGITTFFTAMSALAGSAAVAPFFTLLAAILTMLIFPLAITLLVMLGRRLLMDVGTGRKVLVFNLASLHAMAAQVLFILLAFVAFQALCSLFSLQTRKEIDSTDDNVPRVDLGEESQKLLTTNV